MADLIQQGIVAIKNGQTRRGREILLTALEKEELLPTRQAEVLLWISSTYNDVQDKLDVIYQAGKIDPFNPAVIEHINYYAKQMKDSDKSQTPDAGRNDEQAKRNNQQDGNWASQMTGAMPPLPDEWLEALSDKKASERHADNSRQFVLPHEEVALWDDEVSQSPASNIGPGSMYERIIKRNSGRPHTGEGHSANHRGRARHGEQQWTENERINYARHDRIWITRADSTEAMETTTGSIESIVVSGERKPLRSRFWYVLAAMIGFIFALVITGVFVESNILLFQLIFEIAGISLIIVLLERRAEHRATLQLKKRLVWQAGSRSNEMAKVAIDWIRAENWLTKKSILVEQTMRRSNLAEAYLKDANLEGTDFELSNFTNAHLANANMNKCTLIGTFFMGALLVNTKMQYANLRSARMTQADLRGADLTGAILTGADLTGANLTNANLTGATIRGIILTDAITANVNWTGVTQN